MTDQSQETVVETQDSGLFGGGGDKGSPFGGTPADSGNVQPEAPANEGEGEGTVDEVVVGEAEKEQVTPDANRDHEFKYDPTGNASLDYALQFVGELGFGPNHPAILAAKDGNFNLISAELAREGVRGADAVVALAKEAYQQETAKANAAKQEVAKYAYEAAGGEANWKQVQGWASANATPEEKAQINSMLAAGGFAAQSAISFLVQQYSKVNTLDKPAAKVAKPNAAGGRSSDTGGALTAGEYGRLVQALVFKHGGRDVSGTAEYQELQQRRLQGRRSGI